jgi:hypothetical protein
MQSNFSTAVSVRVTDVQYLQVFFRHASIGLFKNEKSSGSTLLFLNYLFDYLVKFRGIREIQY